MNITTKILSATALMLCTLATSVSAQTVNLYTYHLTGPFVTGKGTGLTYDMAAYLTKKSAGKYDFVVSELPRKRLNKTIAGNKPGVVPWVSPLWFGDKGQTKYLWSNGYFKDGNDLLSSIKKPFEYTGDVKSLQGLKFGGERGHHYKGIDEMVKTGDVTRVDAKSITANLRKIAAGRIDVTSVNNSAARYLVEKLGIKDHVHFSSKQFTQYNRHFLVMKSLPEVGAFLSGVTENMADDAEWQTIVKKYR
jgi:polar amino acid transport system substrate-binding protein